MKPGLNQANDNAYRTEKDIDTLANEYTEYIDKVKEKATRINTILEAIGLEEGDETIVKASPLDASVIGHLSALDTANLRWATTILYTYGHVLYRHGFLKHVHHTEIV